jgi:transposase
MPLPPKGKRRKTDKIDTARMMREYLHGALPRSFQPSAWWREVRRVVDCRQDLVERQTAIKNWLASFLHHETWEARENLWSGVGQRRLSAMKLSQSDRAMVDLKLVQLEQLAGQIKKVEGVMQATYDAWPQAQWVFMSKMTPRVRSFACMLIPFRGRPARTLNSPVGAAPIHCAGLYRGVHATESNTFFVSAGLLTRR